jgi:hypothetical protein
VHPNDLAPHEHEGNVGLCRVWHGADITATSREQLDDTCHQSSWGLLIYVVVANCLTGQAVKLAGVYTRVLIKHFVKTYDNADLYQSAIACPYGAALTGGGYQGAVNEPLDAGVFPYLWGLQLR